MFSDVKSIYQDPVFPGSFYKHVEIDQDKENLIGYLSIIRDHPIDQSTYIYVKFALEEFKKQDVKFILLHLDTPGGQVFSTLKIINLFKKFDQKYGIPIISFIDNWAVSAGAMLSYACRYIGIVPTSIMGAAEPVIGGKNGQMESASEKVNSALRAEVSNLAALYGRDPLIAKAMVDKDLILVWKKGKAISLQSNDSIRNQDVITRGGKLLTLDATDLIKYGLASFEVSGFSNPSLIENKEGVYSAKDSAAFINQTLQSIPNAKLITYSNWKIDFFAFLSHPAVSTVLLIGFILGMYIEMNTPGFGIFGAISVCSLVLLAMSHFSIYTVSILEIVFILVGIVLLALEIFVIPGFGLIGILGVILLVLGLFFLSLPNIDGMLNFEKLSLIKEVILERGIYFVCGIFLSLICIWLFYKYLASKIPFFNCLVLKGEQEKDLGFYSGIKKEQLPSLGAEGISTSPLIPYGKIEINGTLYHGRSEGVFMEKGSSIKVIDVSENIIVVRKLL